jgi:hypothetical protein
MDKIIGSSQFFNAVAAEIREIGDEGPRVLVWMGEDAEDLKAFSVVTPDAAREMAILLNEAADAADNGQGRLLPPAAIGGRA